MLEASKAASTKTQVLLETKSLPSIFRKDKVCKSGITLHWFGTGRRNKYEKCLYTAGISRSSKISRFSRIMRKWSDSPLFSTLWGFSGTLESLNSVESLEMDFSEKTPSPKDPFFRARLITVIKTQTAAREKLQLQPNYPWLPRKSSTNHYITAINPPPVKFPYVARVGAFFCTSVSPANGHQRLLTAILCLNSTLRSTRTLETVEEISPQNPVNAQISGHKKARVGAA